MKKLIIIVFIFVIFLSIIINFYNSSNKTDGVGNKTEVIEIYTYEELATLPLEKTCDYEDVLKDMELNGLDTEERIANFKTQHEINTKSISPNSTETVRYAKFAMDSYKFTNLLKKYELTPVFYIGLYYDSNGVPEKIVSIAEPYIRTSTGAQYIFDGEIFYRLESGNSFYYGVNGNVYKTTNIFIKNIDFDGRYYSSSLNSL